MRALLLAAGLGSRLRPITNVTPKCLVKICGKPLLDYWLYLLIGNGVDRILINTHYLAHCVEDYIANSPFHKNIEISYESSLLGTAGTIRNNIEWFQNQSFMVIHADNLSIFDVKKFINAHEQRPSESLITMMTFITDTPESCGIVQINSKGLVKNFYEKEKNPAGNLANGAVYIFEPEVLDYLKKTPNLFDISKDVLPNFLGKISVFHNSIYHRDIGTLESLQIAENDFKSNFL